MTEYRDIPNHPGYRAGDDGSIWSCANNRWGKTDQWQQLTPQTNNKHGRQTIGLGRNNTRYVHQLILEAFIGPRPNDKESLHRDGNAGNNTLGNLRWGTKTENGLDARRHGKKKGEKHHNAILTDVLVREIRQRGDSGEVHQAIADDLGLQRRNISRIIDRTRWPHVI